MDSSRVASWPILASKLRDMARDRVDDPCDVHTNQPNRRMIGVWYSGCGASHQDWKLIIDSNNRGVSQRGVVQLTIENREIRIYIGVGSQAASSPSLRS